MKKGTKFKKKDLLTRGTEEKTIDRKIYEMLSSGLIYPIPTIEDFRKYVYVSLEDSRSFEEVRNHLLDKITEYIEADDSEKVIIWYEIIMELELLYLKGKKNRLSATRVLLLDLLWCAKEYGEKIIPLLKEILPNVKEVMPESEIRKYITLLVEQGFFIGLDVGVTY